MTKTTHHILADGRWQGAHGIGRFSNEVLSRLSNADIFTSGPSPLSIKNQFWQTQLLLSDKTHRVFYSPGFNPTLLSRIPVVFTIHDLIHINVPEQTTLLKNLFYRHVVKPAAKKARAIITVSEFSKKTILDWVDIPEEKIIVAYPGVSQCFQPEGDRYQPGFPYLLHVGNAKTHKNVARLVQAFAIANIDKDIKLISTGALHENTAVCKLIKQYQLEDRVLSHSNLSEATLAAYYRGALGVVFPSLYEGFGLPVVEGMASGVPVLTANTTSLPEIANGCAILTNPFEIDAIAHGLNQLINDHTLRNKLIKAGLTRAQQFNWDHTAERIQALLNQIAQG